MNDASIPAPSNNGDIEQLRKQAMIVSHMLSGALIADASGTVEWVNPSFHSVTDQAADEPVGMSLRELLQLIGVEDTTLDQISDNIERGQGFNIEVPPAYHLGIMGWLSVEGNAIHNNEGDVIQYLAVFDDITERKVAEESILHVERKYRALTDNAIEGIFQTSADGTFIDANPALIRILGYDSREDLVNSIENIGDEMYVDPDRRQAFVDLMDQDGQVGYFESQVLMKDGTAIWISENAHTVRDTDQNELLYYEGFVEDITARKIAEAKLKQKAEELETANNQLKQQQAQLVQSEKLASLGTLAAGVAHEINNPVGYVISNLKTMREYVDSFKLILGEYDSLLEALKARDLQAVKSLIGKVEHLREEEDIDYVVDDVEQLLTESTDGANRVKEIVQNLKSFARVDEAEIKEADINQGIEATLKMVWNELKYKCTVHKNLQPLPKIHCYPGQLNQVITNLVVNAAQAIKDKGEVTIESFVEGDEIVVRVSDTGSGIPDDVIPKLFTPFFTTKPVGKGTGLGLSISYGIVDRHGGRIELDTKVGKGTVFTVRLPIDGIAEPEHSAPIPTDVK